MGTHQHVCGACGWKAELFNSCRDRHCPQCQGAATDDWLTAQEARMLPVGHFQVVFTLPQALREVVYDNPKSLHSLLFRVGASVVQDLAAQRHQARLGLTGVLHTWTDALLYHPHVHFLVSAGGLHLETGAWVSTGEKYLFPGRILGAMFRGRFLEGLLDAFERGELVLRGEAVTARKQFRSMVRGLSKRHAKWVVHVEAPGGRPVSQVVKYLARYIKRVAISDARLVSVSEDAVTFRTRQGPVSVSGVEFVRRFQLHILPSGFRKVRHYGLYAPGAMGGAARAGAGAAAGATAVVGRPALIESPPSRGAVSLLRWPAATPGVQRSSSSVGASSVGEYLSARSAMNRRRPAGDQAARSGCPGRDLSAAGARLKVCAARGVEGSCAGRGRRRAYERGPYRWCPRGPVGGLSARPPPFRP